MSENGVHFPEGDVNDVHAFRLKSPWDSAAVTSALAASFRAAPIPSIVLPGAVEVRAAPRVKLTPFFIADRGRYDAKDLPEPPALRALAESLCGRPLAHAGTRLLRLRPGGYALFLDDERTRLPACVEVTVDLSRRDAGPAVEYRSANARVLVPQLRGALAVVQRDAGVWRCDRYLPKTAGKIPVLRLRAVFRFLD